MSKEAVSETRTARTSISDSPWLTVPAVPWQASLDAAAEALGAPVAALYVRSTSAPIEALQATSGAPRTAFVSTQAAPSIPLEPAHIEPVMVPRDHPLIIAPPANMRSAMFLPVLGNDGGRVGMVLFGRTGTAPITDGEARLARLAARQLGVLVEHQALEAHTREGADQAVLFQKTLLEGQTEASMDGILVVSREGKILLFNSRFLLLWGLSYSAVAARSDTLLLETVHEKIQDPEEFRARVAYLYEHPDEESHEQVALKDGRIFDRYSAPVKGQGNKQYGRVWFFRDMTTPHQEDAENGALSAPAPTGRAAANKQRAHLAELAMDLSQQQRWSETLLGLMPVPVVLISAATLQVYSANHAADKLAGGEFPRTRLRDAPTNSMAGEFAAVAERVADGERLTGHQLEVEAPGGHKSLFVHGLLLPAIEGHEASVVLCFDEITDLTRVQVQLQRAVNVRDEFLSIASHELKTPVTALQLQVQSVLRNAEKQGESLPRDWVMSKIGRADGQVSRLIRLINNLLDVSRITGGHMDFEPEALDFTDVVREVSERFREDAAQAHCTLTLHEREPIMGACDRVRLEQVVTNLLTNALKYGAGHPVEIWIEPRGSDGVRLQVADQGIGISRENQQRIFERFERAVSDRQYGGLGLGLWITRQIIEAMNGTIRVDSEPGEGSCFTVDLHRYENPPASALSPALA